MNINILDNTCDVSKYLNILASSNFISCINNFTRITNVSKSCIEHTFINDISNLSSYIIKTDITDHYSLAIGIDSDNFIEKCIIDKNTHKNTNVRLNFSNLNNLLLSFNWYNFLFKSDVDILIDKFNTKINEFMIFLFMISASKKCIISKNKFKKSQKYKAWITNGLL